LHPGSLGETGAGANLLKQEKKVIVGTRGEGEDLLLGKKFRHEGNVQEKVSGCWERGHLEHKKKNLL